MQKPSDGSKFYKASNSEAREPKARAKIAWRRTQDPNITFFTIGTSTIGGNDIIQGEFTEISQPDTFIYDDESENIISIATDSELVEPMGGLVYNRGSVILDNTSGRYSPKKDTSIGDYILPNRPLKLYTGFNTELGEKYLPAIYGLSGQPQRDKKSGNTKIDFFDYISFIDEYKLETTKYVNQRSDQIIEDILLTIGFTAGQFELDEGLNTIGFTWFPKGTKAGKVIRELCQAEQAVFYQNEFGLIKFENRRKFAVSPYIHTQWTFDKDVILDWQENSNSEVINRVEVKAYPREVQGITEVWRAGTVLEIPQGTTSLDVWATFDDPVNEITDCTATTDYLGNSLEDGTGTDLTSFISITTNKFVTSAKLEITNTYTGTVYLTLLRLRGTPAIVVSEIEEIFEDTESIERYGTKALTIENNYIDSESFAYYMARTIVNQRKDSVRKVQIVVDAQPQLQIRDKISIQDPDTNIYLDMRILRIQLTFDLSNGFNQILTLREITDLEADTPFTIGVSTIDGTDVIWI